MNTEFNILMKAHSWFDLLPFDFPEVTSADFSFFLKNKTIKENKRGGHI